MLQEKKEVHWRTRKTTVLAASGKLKFDNENWLHDTMTRNWSHDILVKSRLTLRGPLSKLTCIHAHEWLTNSSKSESCWTLRSSTTQCNSSSNIPWGPETVQAHLNSSTTDEMNHMSSFQINDSKKNESTKLQTTWNLPWNARLSQLSFATVRCLFGRSLINWGQLIS